MLLGKWGTHLFGKMARAAGAQTRAVFRLAILKEIVPPDGFAPLSRQTGIGLQNSSDSY